jgi:hypothetical protein
MHDQTGSPPTPARRTAADDGATARVAAAAFAAAEHLERRTLMAIQAPVTLSIGPNVNITRQLENQNEAAIAIDRTNPGNLFMASVNDTRGTGALDDVDLNNDGIPDQAPFLRAGDVRGLIGARSEDAGATWVSGALDEELVDINTGAPLPAACCDPSVAFDDFGNLFATFINRNTDEVIVALSNDLGRTFNILTTFPGEVDQPTIKTGENSVWVTFQLNGEIVASGAQISGPGVVQTFSALQAAPRSEGGNFGDIAIGPNGEVIVTYQIPRLDPDIPVDPFDEGANGDPERTGPNEIFVNVDPDGFGPELFGKRFKVTDTNVGTFDPVPAQANRTVDAEAGLAWDRSGGPFNGRIWMVYTTEARDQRDNDLDIFLRFSDDQGRTWSSPRVVTDEDFTQGTQFLPRIALDQTTGNIAITWHDTRMQDQNVLIPNNTARYFGTVGVPTVGEAGVAFADNVQISAGFSDAHRAMAAIEYGDYSGLDFHNNVFYPVWADNSNSTGDNPSGGVMGDPSALATLDVYTARVQVTPISQGTPDTAPVGPGSPLKPDFVGKQTITKGKVFKFQVRYESPNGVNLATLGDDDLLITGPKGYNLFADFIKGKPSKRGTVVTGMYQAFAPGGKWDQGDNGLYSILLQPGAVSDLANTSTDAGLLDQFLVASSVASQSPLSPAVMPASSSARSLQVVSTSLKAEDGDDELARELGL